MNIRTLFILALFSAGTVVHAQQFAKSSNVISAGIGLGSAIGGFTSSSQGPAISVQYEKGMWEIDGPGVISLGGYAAYKSFSAGGRYGTNFTYSQKWTYTVIGVRSAYHYTGISAEKVDVYGGLMLSYNILSYSYEDSNPSGVRFDNGSYGNALGFSVYVGGRYFFTPRLAALAELGYGVSYLSVGLAWKL